MNSAPTALLTTTYAQRHPHSALAIEQAHLQKLIAHPDLTWFDHVLIAVSAPGPILLPLSTGETEQLVAQLTGQQSTLWQRGTETLATLLNITPQGLFSAAKMTLILCDWLSDEPIKTICTRWDITHDKLRTLIARSRRLIDTIVEMAREISDPTSLATYRLQTLAKMLHGFAPKHTSLLVLPGTPLWVLRTLLTAHITTLEKLAASPLKRLEALFTPALADKLHHDARRLLDQYPSAHFTVHALHQGLPTIQEVALPKSIFSMVA